MNTEPMPRLKFYCGLILGIALTLFALSNLQAIPVSFLFWSVSLPLVVTVVLSAATGAIWASLWMTFARRRKRGVARDGSVFTQEALPPPAQANVREPAQPANAKVS